MAFASEIKSILTLPTVGGDVNEAMLRDFLLEGRVDHTEATFFENIWAAPPGCFIELDLRARGVVHTGGVVRRYWRPSAIHTSPSNASVEMKSLLTESVRSHLRSDVPVGSCLSGGLDSSAIVCLIDKLSRDSVDAFRDSNWSQHTFTASLPGTTVDETKYAQAVVEACPGLRSSIVTPTAEQFVRDVGALVWHQEQPFGSPSIYLQWEVMRLASENGVKVLLDGQGGDELFCGYEGQIPPYLAHLLLRGRWVRFWKEYRAARSEHFRDGSLVGHIAAHVLPRDIRDQLRRRAKARRMGWLAGDLMSVEEPEGLCAALKLSQENKSVEFFGNDGLSRFLWSLILSDSLPSLFRFEDRNSMAFSIEARVPFLDHRLVEAAMGLPMDLKINDGRLKVVLREAMKGIVPNLVLERRDKIGFAAPTQQWMQTGLREWWVELLTSKSFRYRGCFNVKGVRDAIERFQKGDLSVTNDLWRMAIVEQWARQFLDH